MVSKRIPSTLAIDYYNNFIKSHRGGEINLKYHLNTFLGHEVWNYGTFIESKNTKQCAMSHCVILLYTLMAAPYTVKKTPGRLVP